MSREQKALGVYAALLLGVLALFLLLDDHRTPRKDQPAVRASTEPTLRVWSADGRRIGFEVCNRSRETILIPDCFLIPPDAIPVSFSVEIKDGDRPLLRLPAELTGDTRLPLFGMMITYHRVDPGESYTEDIDLGNLPPAAPAAGRRPLSCTVETYYLWDRDFRHDSRQPVPHLEGGSSADFPGAHRLRHCFKLRRPAPTASPKGTPVSR
jgi:hypothetical protein